MSTFIGKAWRRLPVSVRASLTGVATATAGTVPWALLVSANTRHLSAVPWAVPAMAAYLVLYWRYVVRGAGWPSATSAARRACARANPLNGDAWASAIIAGMLGLMCVLLIQGLMGRMVVLPQQKDIDPSQYPALTVFLWLAMSAVVSGVVEESSFRGYLQRPIERRHGPFVAILVSGMTFGFAHFTHPEVGLVLLPYYVAVAAVYGMLAYLTDSVYPSMVPHAGGNIFSTLDFLTTGRSEWQVSRVPRPLIWETGPDLALWGTLIALLVVGALTVMAYMALASVERVSHPGGTAGIRQ